MPEWLTEYAKQSPTLAVCLLIVYLAGKYSQGLHTRYLESLEKAHSSHLASKGAEIKRLCDELEAVRKEREKLVKAMTAKENHECLLDNATHQCGSSHRLRSVLVVANTQRSNSSITRVGLTT